MQKGYVRIEKPEPESCMSLVWFECMFCGKEHCVLMNDEDIERFDECQNQMLIQDIFPDKDPEFRELFMTGICPECQKRFKQCEEDPEDD